MIYVRVEMWPRGSRAGRYLLGEALVENKTGGGPRADYRAVLSKKGGFRSEEREVASLEVKNAWKDVGVPGFRRSRLGFWHLLRAALDAACGGTDGG